MISAMLRFSWGRSLGTAAAASGCPLGELTSFIFPGTGWRLLDGGLNLRLALGSTGIRITTALDYQKRQQSLSSSSLLSFCLSFSSLRNSLCAALLAEPQRLLPTENGTFSSAHRVSKPSPLQTFVGAFKRNKTYFPDKKNSPDDVLNDKLFFFRLLWGSVHAP